MKGRKAKVQKKDFSSVFIFKPSLIRPCSAFVACAALEPSESRAPFSISAVLYPSMQCFSQELVPVMIMHLFLIVDSVKEPKNV